MSDFDPQFTTRELSPGAKEKLKRFARNLRERQFMQMGYPFAQECHLHDFYAWINEQGLDHMTVVNVGSPYKKTWNMINSDEIEAEVIDFFANAYGFRHGHWGFVTSGGTDGNMHGVYLGRKSLAQKSTLQPIIYVSEEAHYSVKKIADVQNTEVRIIPTSTMGEMLPQALAEALDPSRPALVVYAIGGTFKGAIDNQIELNKVVDQINPIAVYRHCDIALFGGYFPFLKNPYANAIVDHEKMNFDSVAVSAHKFFSLSEPAGAFVCTQETFDSVHAFPVPYLNGAVPTISCSRSGLNPVKFYWRIQSTGVDGFRERAEYILKISDYVYEHLKFAGIPVWRNELSNTLFMRRPSEAMVDKYSLACCVDPELGPLSHCVLMQYLTKEMLDTFICDIVTDMYPDADMDKLFKLETETICR